MNGDLHVVVPGKFIAFKGPDDDMPADRLWSATPPHFRPSVLFRIPWWGNGVSDSLNDDLFSDDSIGGTRETQLRLNR